MFIVVTIKDLKYYLQRDELITLLVFVTLGPASVCIILSQDVVFRITECDL